MNKREFDIVPSKHIKDMFVPSDVWEGTESHPQCCFFEMFQSSSDPYETFYGALLCHMDYSEKSALTCLGDYCKCPLSNQNLTRCQNE